MVVTPGKLHPKITQAEPSTRAGVPGMSKARALGMRLLPAKSDNLKHPPPPLPPLLLQEWKEILKILSEDSIWMSVQHIFLLSPAIL